MGQWTQVEAGSARARAYLAVPKSGSGPGVLVCHAWWGLNEVFVALCDRLAAEGFVALAPDMYAGTVVDTIEDAEAAIGRLTGDHAQAVATAGLNALLARSEVSRDRIGLIGFSMGSSWALWLSTTRPEHVAAVVSFYGAGEGDFTAATASYLGHFAPGDEWEPDKWVNGMESAIREAGREVTFHWYPGAGHWFFESNRPDAYNAEAADLALQRTLSFLRAELA